MSTPVVIQGTPVVHQPTAFTGLSAPDNKNSHNNNTTNHNGSRDDKVESSCNDPIFAVLFYIALIAIIVVAATYGADALQNGTIDGSTNNNSNEVKYDYSGYITITVIITVLSFIGAGLGMSLLFCIPQFLIKTALIFTVVMAGAWCAISFATGNILGGIIGAIFFAITVCYAYAVWSRIPFATANLVTACTAIKANLGIAFYAYIFAFLAGAWSIGWAIAVMGVFDQTYTCTQVNGMDVCSNPSYGILFVLFLAFFFVQQVLQNSIHVTVAGTVGTWWYAPDECGCCASAVNSSFIRTVTTSFGSICFGSFLVALLQALRAIAQSARENGDAQIFACIAECILGCLASILEYFNKWAFIYVGLYGMPYMKAGKSVFELFQNRGWEAIIADDLVGNTLFLISVIVGALMGCVGLIVEAAGDTLDDVGGNAKIIAFVLGFVIGLVITSILMSTIGSGVNAVIVLFAEGPNEFQQNHPELSNKMREVWNQVYPGSV